MVYNSNLAGKTWKIAQNDESVTDLLLLLINYLRIIFMWLYEFSVHKA